MSQTLSLIDRAAADDDTSYSDRCYAEGRALVGRIEALLPSIAARVEETESLQRVAEASLREMSDAGLFRCFVPRQFGGLEIDPASFFECLILLGSACPSSAWVGGFYGVHAWQIALMDKRVQEEIWGASTDRGIASSYAPTGKVTSVDGGFVLNGSWAFCSGIDGADWVILGGVVTDGAYGTEARSFVVPKSDYSIDPDSWNVVGLTGSGSRTITLVNAVVPDHRTHRVIDAFQRTERGFEINDRALYKLSWLSMFYNTIAAVATGAAIGAVDAFMNTTRSRVSAVSGMAAAQNPYLHLRAANALNSIDLLRERLPRRWREDFDRACAGGESDIRFRKRARFEAADTTATAFDAVSAIIEMGGGNVIDRDRPVQRFFRDLLAMRNHPTAQREAFAAVYVEDLLGLPAPEFSPAAMGSLLYHG